MTLNATSIGDGRCQVTDSKGNDFCVVDGDPLVAVSVAKEILRSLPVLIGVFPQSEDDPLFDP